ncbi:MAG: hypothetical protein J5598_03735 [Clostridia bacterium]|nr:hypothetical protein [Clostridia bacterium]
MLADTLQMLHDTEDEAEQIIAQAHVEVREIEKQTYQEMTKLENQTNAEIAAEIAKLPQPEPLAEPTVKLDVPANKMKAAVDYIIQAVHGA